MNLRILMAVALIGSSHANNSFQVDFANLRDEAGDLLSSETLVLLIADSSGDLNLPSPADLLGAQLSEGLSINGDQIFLVGHTINDPLISPDPATDFALFKGLANVDYLLLDVAEGDIWGIYWFPGLVAEGEIVQADQPYGTYQSGNIDPPTAAFGATSAMTFPAADLGGSQMTIYYDDTTLLRLGIAPDPAYTPTAADFTASYIVVPEPATTLLIAVLGLCGVAGRRRCA
jgi:hypothetical protein